MSYCFSSQQDVHHTHKTTTEWPEDEAAVLAGSHVTPGRNRHGAGGRGGGGGGQRGGDEEEQKGVKKKRTRNELEMDEEDDKKRTRRKSGVVYKIILTNF